MKFNEKDFQQNTFFLIEFEGRDKGILAIHFSLFSLVDFCTEVNSDCIQSASWGREYLGQTGLWTGGAMIWSPFSSVLLVYSYLE